MKHLVRTWLRKAPNGKADATKQKTSSDYRFFIDSPKRTKIDSKEIFIKGWFIPGQGKTVKTMRVKNGNNYSDLAYGIKRKDLVDNIKEYRNINFINSGFEKTVTFQDGNLSLEVDLGEGFFTFWESAVFYSPENTYETYYNPEMSTRLAEHKVLLENKKTYYFEEEHLGTYQRHEDDAKLIAFYLPQFHPIKQNDTVWGKGFTEWRNVSQGQPRFIGHQQPFLPSDLGFYDLRLEDTILEQINLAKKYGIYAFCFYYYWFSGEVLLDRPLNTFLKHKEWDFNFMICWANENWTKRWDGRDNDIIIAQKYLESDPLKFIKDVEHIILDDRYIRKNNRPVLAVYRGSELDHPKRYTEVWREYFLKKHNLELEIVTMLNFEPSDPRPNGFDAGIEFSPVSDFHSKNFDRDASKVPYLQDYLLDLNFEGKVFDYRAFMANKNSGGNFSFPTYKSISPSWDNEARKKSKGSLTLYGANPDLYGFWLNELLVNRKTENDNYIFVNAWNEWAEGTVLEPTIHLGHSVLRRTAEMLSRHSGEKNNVVMFPAFGIKKRKHTTEIAVVVHIYYEEEWEEIASRLSVLDGIEYDLFVTLTKKNAHLLSKIKSRFSSTHIELIPNRGRDVLPFVQLLPKLQLAGYVYLLKLHTKKTVHRIDGNEWFESCVTPLLSSRIMINKIIHNLKNGVALIGPAEHFLSVEGYIAGNKKHIVKFLHRSGINEDLISNKGFFAGTMFWARIDAFETIIKAHPIIEEFESEKSQQDGTYSHALERLFGLIPQIEGKKVFLASGKALKEHSAENIIEDNYKFAINSTGEVNVKK